MNSPQFSPNGEFETPRKSGRNKSTKKFFNENNSSPIIGLKKIEIKSSLFPDLEIFSSRSKKSYRTPKTVLCKKSEAEYNINENKNYSVPAKKSQRRELLNDFNVLETDSSSVVSSSTLECDESPMGSNSSQNVTTLGIKPLSCESFYGAPPQIQKVRTKLFIDTLDRKGLNRNLTRSLSKESLTSNRSFVNGKKDFLIG